MTQHNHNRDQSRHFPRLKTICARTTALVALFVFSPAANAETHPSLKRANNEVDSEFSDKELQTTVMDRFTGSPEERAIADMKLTAIWLILASHINGRVSDEDGMVRSTDTRITRSDFVTALRRAAETNSIAKIEQFASLAPKYGALKDALKQY